MQMHDSKANATRSGTASSNHKSNSSNNNNNTKGINSSSNNQTSSTSSNSKKSRTKNTTRDRNPDNDAKSAPVMSNLSSYLIDEDHIDDQESINVGNLIIDLESDLEKEKNEIEQANNNNVKSNPCSASNAPSSTSSSSSLTPFVTNADINKSCNRNNINKATSSTNNSETSNRSVGKFNQKSSNKHSTTGSSAANSSIIASSNNGHTSSTTRTVFKSSADERGELKMKITRETKPAKSDHRVAASPNQKSPTCSSSSNSNSNNNNPLTHSSNYEDSCTTYDTLSNRPAQLSNISSTKECGTSTSVGTITEPECLGPCEPGTSVTLEGIVWQETDGGILVVNVTWRGKTYVGALLDCTRHDWAPPRLCDSPASDIDSKTSKNVRTKRIVTRSNGIGLDDKNLLQTTGKLRNGKGRRIPPSNDPTSCTKKQREPSDKPTNENSSSQAEINAPLPGGEGVSSITNSENATVPMNVDTISASTNQRENIEASNISTDNAGPNSPMLIGCSEPNCSKKYRNMNGLLYHQTHAHGGDNEPSTALDDNCSSSTKDKLSKPIEDPKEDDQMDTSERTSLNIDDRKKSSDEEQQTSGALKRERTPSPQISIKMSNKVAIDQPKPLGTIGESYPTQETSRSAMVKNNDFERRHSSNSSVLNVPRVDELNRRSPGAPNRHPSEFQSNLPIPIPGSHLHHNHSSSKPSSNGPKQSINNQPPPLPATTEEGMKPSGTSTGPPPAPHQANCYFNSAFLANTFNPYALPPYFPRNMYDPIAPPVLAPTSNPAFISRFMNSMRNPPPPESPSRMLSPSMPKNLPFPPFKVEPGGAIPPPLVATSMANPPLPNLPPMPPLGSGGPIPPPPLRMPSQGDPMLPPTSQPPFLPHGASLNSALMRLPGPPNPLGPTGPQIPSLVEDPLKQFPRRFN